MEYQEVITVLSEETNYTRKEIRKLLRVLAHIVQDGLAAGRDVQLIGIGRFKNVPVGTTYGRNMWTGERVVIPPRRRLRFRASDQIMEAIGRSEAVFRGESLARKYGVEETNGDQVEDVGSNPSPARSAAILRGRPRQGDQDGEVRSGDRPEQGPQRKTSRGRR